jgi:hypothetical protein
MSREKIKVPRTVYDELVAFRREVHFTLDHTETIQKAEDMGYLNAAAWIRQNENAYKIGFSWGFEPYGDDPKGTLRTVPAAETPVRKKTADRPIQTMEPRDSKKSTRAEKSGGFFSGIKKWLKKHF